jgi:hypothetical protein
MDILRMHDQSSREMSVVKDACEGEFLKWSFSHWRLKSPIQSEMQERT